MPASILPELQTWLEYKSNNNPIFYETVCIFCHQSPTCSSPGSCTKNFIPKSPLESWDGVLWKDKELLKLPMCSKKACPFSDSGKTKFTSISYVTKRNTEKHAPHWSGASHLIALQAKCKLLKAEVIAIMVTEWGPKARTGALQSIRNGTVTLTQKNIFVWGLVMSLAGLRNESKFSDVKLTQESTYFLICEVRWRSCYLKYWTESE